MNIVLFAVEAIRTACKIWFTCENECN